MQAPRSRATLHLNAGLTTRRVASNARPCIPQVSGRFLFEHLASGLSRGRIGSMDADLSMMALWERATRAVEAVKKGIDECTETLLGTLQILAPGDAPQSGFEWTVYGPKV